MPAGKMLEFLSRNAVDTQAGSDVEYGRVGRIRDGFQNGSGPEKYGLPEHFVEPGTASYNGWQIAHCAHPSTLRAV